MSKKYMPVLLCILLSAATVIVFAPVRGYDFVGYDDDQYVVKNEQVKRGITVDGLWWSFTATEANNWHPLTWLSHSLDCQFFGVEAGAHHLVNLAFHTINTLLLFYLLWAATGGLWASAFVAAAFAVHPVHVESVAWISERKDVLSTMFWLATMIAYVGYARKTTRVRYAVVIVLFALGLLAKPMLVTLPFVLLLFDYWPLGRLTGAPAKALKQKRQLYGLVREKAPLFALSAVSSVITFVVQWKTGAVKTVETFPVDIRVANVFLAYVRYILKIFWPSRLAIYYPHFGTGLLAWQVILAATVLVASTVLIFRVGDRYRFLLMGWLWYLGTLVPVIGLVQAGGQSMADRYTYIPAIGIFIMAAWSGGEFLGKQRAGRIALSVAGILLVVAMGVGTRLQLRHWQDRFTLFRHAVNVTERNYIMHYNLGVSLQKQGKLEEAMEEYLLSLRIKPDYAMAHNNLGDVLESRGRRREAIAHYREATRLEPGYAVAQNNLGAALEAEGKTSEAVECYRRAIKLAPKSVEPYKNLAKSMQLQGRYEESIENWRKAVELEGDCVATRLAMGETYQLQGRLDEAIEQYREGLKIRPDDMNAVGLLGVSLGIRGKSDEAVEYMRQALGKRPDNVVLRNNLGTVLARTGKFVEAAEQFEYVTRIDPNNFQGHSNLGGALAKLNRFGEAIEHYERAVQLKPNYPQTRAGLGLALQMTGRLAEAMEQYREALRIKPDLPAVLNNAAQILIIGPDMSIHDPNEGLKLALQAAKLTENKDTSVLVTVAQGYAAKKDYKQAVVNCSKALELAERRGDREFAEQIRGLMEKYKRAESGTDE